MIESNGEIAGKKRITQPLLYRVIFSRIGLLLVVCLFTVLVIATSLRNDDRIIVEPVEKGPNITIDELDGNLKTARNDIHSNAEKIANLTEIVSSDGKIIASLRNTLESQRNELESLRKLTAEREHPKSEQKASPEVRTASQPLPVKPTRRRAAPRLRRPPFQLVTIDYWNNVPSAVIRANNRLHTLEPGSSLQEWTVDKIDARAGEVTLRNRQGQSVKITGGND